MNHYHWLEKHFTQFTKDIGLSQEGFNGNYSGLIVAHGDKCYSYKDTWEEAQIPFPHGVALYLLTYVRPYSKEVRSTDKGWVDPKQWVVDNYPKFKNKIPAAFKTACELKVIPFPACSAECGVIEHLGAGECDSVCPYKFNEAGDVRSFTNEEAETFWSKHDYCQKD